MSSATFFQRIAFLLVIACSLEAVVSQIQPGHRIYSDDASCICGIDLALLDRIEVLLKAIPEQSCPAPPATGLHQLSSSNQTGGFVSNNGLSTGNFTVPQSQSQHEESATKEAEDPTKADPASPSKSQSSGESQQHQTQVVSTENSEATRHPTRPSDINGESSVGSIVSRPTRPQPTEGAHATIQRPTIQLETQIRPSQLPEPPASSSNSELSESSGENRGPTNTGFLNGLTISPVSSHNEALAKLNQSSSNVNEKDMANALQVTVPNLVSNIFSNIKNLTMQTEQNPDRPQPNTLTSIDGSSVDFHGGSKDEITADGEKLFDIWLEHQIETLNLTAVMAGHIRKSAGILFRRIIKQYVERVERMGGKVEQNIQRATQMALNNTQTLIAFLLKNYVNFAAGIMQILGEQVSRVGKQIDSTGDTIAHISLNPFDIISNVIESLPNPSSYSNYFRNFGKQLLGDVVAFSNGGSSNSAGSGSSQSQQNTGSQSSSTPPGGLLTKTIGAFTKFGSWLG